MKLTKLLLVMCCSIIASQAKSTETQHEVFLKRASEQLERLAPYRRRVDSRESDLSGSQEIDRFPTDSSGLNEKKDDAIQTAPWEILEILPEEKDSVTSQTNDEKKRIMIDIITDPKYITMMQERIKRGYDAGSSSLLSGIAGGVFSGIASASSSSAASASSSSAASASSGSSQPGYKPIYGAPHTVYSYGEKPFGPWDFKKAIFGALFQAIKAIGGGVLALKGQLVKGGGYLLSSKGKVISKTGDVITSFGKQLASTALAPPVKPYLPETYAYGHPPLETIEHDPNYQGPPPSTDDFSGAPTGYNAHSSYAVQPDDNDQGGLLIVTPTKSDLNEYSDHHTNTVQEKPDPTKLEESFGGPAKDSAIKSFLSSVPKGSAGLKEDQTIVNEDSNVNSYPPPLDHPVSTYGAPDHYRVNQDSQVPNYDSQVPNYDSYTATQGNAFHPEPPKITSSQHFPIPADHLSIQSNVDYPPFHVHQFEYANGALSNPLLNAPKPPHDDGASVYTSLSIDTEPQMAPLKISLLGYPNAFDLPKFQSHVDFHGQPHSVNLHSHMGGPLKISIMNSLPSHYWQNQGPFAPASTFGVRDPFRRRNVQKRTSDNRFVGYSSLRKTSHRH